MFSIKRTNDNTHTPTAIVTVKTGSSAVTGKLKLERYKSTVTEQYIYIIKINDERFWLYDEDLEYALSLLER